MKLASRLDHIAPFYVMECAKAAAQIARSPACADSPMIFLNIGEPDFTAPAIVQRAAEQAVAAGRTQYTDATGLPALRERISRWYGERFGLDISPGRIVVSGRETTDGLEFRVADNGRGITERDHERIFELFRRSGRQDRTGEGLGLAFVRNSVRRIGGEIRVESELGEGSTFILTFPKHLTVIEAGDAA